MATRALHLEGLEGIPLVATANPRATRLRIRVDAARRQVVAVAPNLRRMGELEDFVRRHEGFIRRHWAALGPARPFAPGTTLPVYGAPTRLMHDAKASRRRWRGQELIVPGALDSFPAQVEKALRERARAVMEEACQFYARNLGEDYQRIRVADTGTRWGSCSARGTLSFSWRLVLAPADVADYVAAHEVAHLRHRHHARAFWDTCAELFGRDPAAERQWLKREGHTLFAWGAAR